ncbi:MAG TPA: UvrB/UvrC motif-containing protein [Phycisphaerae bacterium]|nr:UvrB/UvrC motif-containing protein [Phycisphaerae bacterium]HPS52671.1 UvrB/UvrC motif-containing protein [Phycisphaerae bacterium]
MMSDDRKCDKCGKPATVHLTEIVDGKKLEKHLCEECAEAEGITIKANVPIGQLLENIIQHAQETASGEMSQNAAIASAPANEDVICNVCGMSFAEYNEHGLLGCPNDYDAFGEKLAKAILHVQDGSDRHVGKIPANADVMLTLQNRILKLRSDLRQAIHAEQYEHAAQLRDTIKAIEEQQAK